MKYLPHTLLTLIVLLLATACENEIPYHPEQQPPLLVMNALMEAESNENHVYLHLSRGNRIESVKDASLALYVNGKQAETPQATGMNTFRITTPFHAGDRVRLEATAEAGRYHAAAEVTVPQPVDAFRVDTCMDYLYDYGSCSLYRRFDITMKDRPGEKNHYRLEVCNELDNLVSYWDFRYDEAGNLMYDESGEVLTVIGDTLITLRDEKVITSEDVILTDGHPVSREDDSNSFFPIIGNRYNIFTDSYFTDASATLRVFTDYGYSFYPDYWYTRIRQTHKAVVCIHSLTEAGYRYLKALNCLQDDEYDDTLMEPVCLPSNVEGGLGFVDISMPRRKTLLLYEQEFDY